MVNMTIAYYNKFNKVITVGSDGSDRLKDIPGKNFFKKRT